MSEETTRDFLRDLFDDQAITPRVAELAQKWGPLEWGPLCGICGGDKPIRIQSAFCQACYARIPDLVREMYTNRSVFRRAIAAEMALLCLKGPQRKEETP